VRVTVAGRIVAESTRALRLEEKAVASIKECLAFYPSRVDAIEVIS
jgi:uncharacterized protein (DUF427 family)